MSTFDPAHVDRLRGLGYSYSHIGAELGTTKDAARNAHKRWLAGGNVPAEVPDTPAVSPAGAGDAAGGVPVSAPMRPEGPDRDGDSASALAFKSDIELARASITKVTRAEIRLKYSLLADAEINRVLAQRLLDFDRAIQAGYLPTIELKLVSDEAG